ncbi:hypothetical protein FKV24_000165 [Lysobacter maris]|uniref:Uncharacterized protein n=1 Tax=Marilutibacter maris TaxID=1605891 RepID=A0A508BCE0_9GAMM|nr:hypothetical protein [Lysobacter maris]KAB8198835.1 hypothetical protein FKV24_000165 [Lysobacter maris]
MQAAQPARSRVPHPLLRLALPAVALAVSAVAVAAPANGACKRIHAKLSEFRSNEGCNAGLDSCFLGEVDGNHGLNGSTHFASDGWAPGPSAAPGFISYSGAFEYRTADGTLYMRETGITDPAVVTAYQRVERGSGRFQGASGHFFVSGSKTPAGEVTTELSGELCLAPARE